ncbi:ATP-binding response regulator [Pseudoalteromonas denitrificans]|uniref:histidine kinase n=1 Tax=Pseudoalteromonas denitrificans DSM 6059 TaxID=1123010 RepID=A0A1I1P464_9GAMM|nr:hybrid sensor histidine kinase/response regulator [Pseudoalteromonas denitrificans]SFD04731.1 Signal transduction histidine kinase [Pseudoalteromonas denitrificans DSM 6059]
MMHYEKDHINLLLIEGDDSVRNIFIGFIKETSLNISITEAISGQSAIDFCKKNTYQCILLDNELPDMNAQNIMSYLHEGKNISTPVIVFTDNEQYSLDLEILEAGAIDFIPKHHCNVVLLKRLILYALVRNHYQRSHTDYLEQERQVKEKERLHAILVAMERAEAANEAKSQFISSMSHELRTPLNAILGFAQLLEYKQEPPITDEQRSFVEEILKAGGHLLNLINEVLDLSKIEAGQLHINIEEVLFSKVLAECLTLTQDLAKTHNCTLIDQSENYSNTLVLADHTRLKQVLLNLITNAIKYNKDKGTVSISCDIKADYLHINVIDTGIGISEDKLTEVFEPFSRINETKLNVEGTGIGLTIAKKMMSLMGGDIFLESTLTKGSHFWLEIPIKLDAEIVSNAQFNEVKKNKSELLFIDCNAQLNHSKKVFIQTVEEYEFIKIESIENGILWAENQSISFVFIYMDALSDSILNYFCKLKSLASLSSVPIVVIIQNSSQNDITNILQTGIEQCLTEPLEKNTLQQIINFNLNEVDKTI